jgi:ABC-type Fe3+/spermidine/putrescine transport system ATPase subunit
VNFVGNVSAVDDAASGEVEVRGVGKRFGAVEAVKPTTFRVARGKFVTLLGPSGSAKTTLLKLIAGFDEPSTGTVHIAGRDVTSVAPYRRNVGFVFQRDRALLNFTLSVVSGASRRRKRRRTTSPQKMRSMISACTVTLDGVSPCEKAIASGRST